MNRLYLFCAVVAALSWIYARHNRGKHVRAFAIANNCLPVKNKLRGKWPLNIDLLKIQYEALQKSTLLHFQQPYFKKYGPTFELDLLGGRGYSTIDPLNVETIYNSTIQDWEMGTRRAGIFPLTGEGIFSQDGEAWKHSRALLRKQFARLEYSDLSTFEQYVEVLVDRFASTTGIVDLQPAFFDFTLATTTALLFGEAVDSLGEAKRAEFSHHFDYGTLICAMRLRLAHLCWLYTPKAFKRSCRVVKGFADYFVQRALICQKSQGKERAAEHYPFILDLYETVNESVLVRDQLINVLLAGRDTTACSMSWLFFQLVRNPPVFERLKTEVAEVTEGSTLITKKHIRRMPYLKAVWDETLRLYPQIPVNVRIANKTTYLPCGGGADGLSPIVIPKGTGVGVSTYHMHRSEALYGADANSFRPERWLTGELEEIGWGYLPFHGGPRICLGKDFATLEASYGIIRMIQAYPNMRLSPDAVPVPCGQEPQTLGIVVSSAEGCKVLLT